MALQGADYTEDVTRSEMSRFFVEPDEELEGGGKAPIGPTDPLQRELPENFKALWRTLEQLSTEKILEQVAEQFADAPGRRREVLITFMAQELGYSRVWRRRSSLHREPLWDALSARTYGELSERGESALAMIGRSVRPTRSYLHPTAALATLAVWRHTEDRQLFDEANRRLVENALPDEPEWLYEVVGVFLEDAAEQPGQGRSLRELVELVLDNSYWEVAALLAGLVLVHRYGKWYHLAVVSNLVHATDVASQQYPHEARIWIEYLARATMGGRLNFAWLEEPLRAAIRLNVDDPQRQQQLREYAAGRPFEADHRRLDELYEGVLGQLRNEEYEEGPAHRRLFAEIKETAEKNPTRALRLAELMALYSVGRRVGPRNARLRKSIDRLGREEGLSRLENWLVGLYVHTATLESHAAHLVRRVGDRIDWEANPFASYDDYEIYLVISDYERAFEQLTCKFDGVTLEHADKYAAARIKYFVKKRVDPSRLHRLVETVFTPVGWLGSGLTEVGVVRRAIERGMEHFEERVRGQDMGQEVVAEFRDAGIALESFDEIGDLPVDRVEKVLQSQRRRGILLGAVAGGISGGLAPFSWGILSLADIPIMLSITAGLCSRFCWFFGFDPREHPELPIEILAVALGGTQPSAIEPMLVRQNLHTHMMRKSLVVGAVAHGGVAHLTGRGLSRVVQRGVEKTVTQKAGQLARRAVSRNLQQRAVKAAPSKTLPVLGALLGAALNTALLYDICEAAQAVLTDRFLERKYPEWARHLSQFDAPRLATEDTEI